MRNLIIFSGKCYFFSKFHIKLWKKMQYRGFLVVRQPNITKNFLDYRCFLCFWKASTSRLHIKMLLINFFSSCQEFDDISLKKAAFCMVLDRRTQTKYGSLPVSSRSGVKMFSTLSKLLMKFDTFYYGITVRLSVDGSNISTKTSSSN